MKRRDFVGKLGVGSAALVTPVFAGASAFKAPSQGEHDEQEHGSHGDDDQLEGNAINAVVSFGQWTKNLDAAGNRIPLDRFPNLSPREANNHQMQPFRVTIKQGGSVSFIISGVHQILVYGPGTKLEDVSAAVQEPGPPVPLVNDPNNRIFRGLDPRVLAQDRVESVHFPDHGRFLVVCGVLPHFTEGMHGFVRVKQ